MCYVHEEASDVPAVGVKRELLREVVSRGFATATGLTDYLVPRGVAIRDAHKAVGRAVRLAEAKGRDLATLCLEKLGVFSLNIESNVFAVFSCKAR